MIQNIIENTKLMDYRIGTVKQLGPLVLDIGDNKQVTQFKDNLLFTEQLIKKRVTLTHSHNAIDLNHTHSNDAGETTAALAGAYPTTVKTMSFVINEGIDIGDKLLLLRAQGGQQWIVLSKLRDSSTVTIDQNGGWTWG
jgi:hypothetical protein